MSTNTYLALTVSARAIGVVPRCRVAGRSVAGLRRSSNIAGPPERAPLRGGSAGGGVVHAPQEQDGPRRGVADEEQEGVVDDEGDRLLRTGGRAGAHHDHGRGRRLGALLVHGDERL